MNDSLLRVIWVRATGATVASIALVAVAGCSSPSSPCAVGEPTPISVEAAVAHLREAGFDVHAETEGCGGAVDIVAAIDPSSDLDRDEHGAVYCYVRLRPIYGVGFDALNATEKQAGTWVKDNVECAIYVYSDEATRDIPRLRRAMQTM